MKAHKVYLGRQTYSQTILDTFTDKRCPGHCSEAEERARGTTAQTRRWLSGSDTSKVVCTKFLKALTKSRINLVKRIRNMEKSTEF